MKSLFSNRVILMDPFPAVGHVNAFLNLARWLSENGCEIVFIGSIEQRQLYLEDGFRFHELNPLIIIPAAFEIKSQGYFRFLLENIHRSRSKRTLEYYQVISPAYQRVIDLVKPDLVLLDNHYALKAFLYNQLKINVVMVSTMIAPLQAIGIPPFQSRHVPKDTRMSRMYINWLWAINLADLKIKRWVSALFCLGKTDIKIIREIFGGVPYVLDTSRCFGIGIQEVPLIATYPEPFDFKRNTSVFYFGQMPEVPSDKIDEPRLSALLKHLPAENIIYCSLGTVTFHNLKLCHGFFERIIMVAVKNPQWHFILNVGKHYDINTLSATPQNLSVFVHVPQRQLLSKVAIMINHGGINSIKECLSANIPMIVYPLSRKWDQPGCAARVAYHKIGIVGSIRKDSAKAIDAKIGYLIEHLDEYKKNIQSLTNEIDKVNRSENKRILSLLKHYVKKNSSTKPSFS